MYNSSDLINSWCSAFDRPNILVAAPIGTDLTKTIQALSQGESPCEVVCVETLEDALILCKRGRISVLVISEQLEEPGRLDLILASLEKERPPKIIVLSDSVPPSPPDTHIRLLPKHPDAKLIRRLVLACAKEFDEKRPVTVEAKELLRSLANCPDEGWLRITNAEKFGDIIIQDRKVIYAEAERRYGEAALALIFSWPDCKFEPRSIPGFLAPNMNVLVRDAIHINKGQDSPQPAAQKPEPQKAPQPAAPEPIESISVDEFDESMMPETPQFMQAAEAEERRVEEMASLNEAVSEEPDEMPSFDARAADHELPVEEPQDLMLDDPLIPAATNASAAPASEAAATVRVSDSVFAAVAVVADGIPRLESCQPQAESRHFEPQLIREMYDLSKRYGQRIRISGGPIVQLTLGTCVLVISELPGSKRLVAVRLRGQRFEAAEAAELKRLQETLAITSPLVSA